MSTAFSDPGDGCIPSGVERDGDVNSDVPGRCHPMGDPILFYDSACGFCSRSVQLCLRFDRRGVLRFAPIGGLTYLALPVKVKPERPDSAVLWDGERVHVRGEMAAGVLEFLGWPMAGLGVAIRLTPRPIRDAVYGWVSRHRHELLPGQDTCRLQHSIRKSRFLP